MYGIVSQEKPHRLAWFINKFNPFNFSRVDDYQITIQDKTCAFAQFVFMHEENHTTYTLLANKEESNFLLPEVRNYDYLMVITGATDFFEEQPLKELFKQIPVVQIVYEIETEKLKSKSNLIYITA